MRFLSKPTSARGVMYASKIRAARTRCPAGARRQPSPPANVTDGGNRLDKQTARHTDPAGQGRHFTRRGGGGGGGARDDANDGTAASAMRLVGARGAAADQTGASQWTAKTSAGQAHNASAATHARRGHAVSEGYSSLSRAKPSATRFAHQTKPAPAVTMESGGNLLEASS